MPPIRTDKAGLALLATGGAVFIFLCTVPAMMTLDVGLHMDALLLGMYEHLEAELDAGGFFHPPEKKPSMSQNLRVMLGRAGFSAQEVATFRGVIHALAKGRGRVLAKLAAKKAAEG